MNNNQIDATSYYQLPDGTQLEEEIARMPFWLGSMCKYVWRAGKKDGETRQKDMAKAHHYASLGQRVTQISTSEVLSRFMSFYSCAVIRHGVKVCDIDADEILTEIINA